MYGYNAITGFNRKLWIFSYFLNFRSVKVNLLTLNATLLFIVQLGPILSTTTAVQFGPKQNTKVAFTTTHPPPKTFKVVPGKLEA